MNQIDKLKAEIKEIEDNIDTDDKELLYDVLIIAFFKAKDIIELYDEANPVQEVTDTSSEATEALEAANATIDTLKAESASNATLLQSEIAIHTAAAMERDSLQITIDAIGKLLKD